MAQIRWLGATPAENVQAKFALAVWAKSPEGSPSSPILDYGFQASDYTDQWTLRDGIMLNAFSKWWNGSGKTPKLDEGVPVAPGGGVITASPTTAHLHALSQWSIPLPAGSGGTPPSPQTPPKPTNWPTTAPWPFPKPDWWPAGFPWPPVGNLEPPAWPTVWPPPVPQEWPTNVPFPLPPTINIPSGGLPPIYKLPAPPPPRTSPTRTATTAKKEEKKSNAIWWVLGALAVGGVVFASMGASAGAAGGSRQPNPQKRPKSGYAYWYPRTGWKRVSDEEWETVVYTPTGQEKWVGTRKIDDVMMDVWKTERGHIAQTYNVALGFSGR